MNKINLHIALQKLLSLSYVAVMCAGGILLLSKLNTLYPKLYALSLILILSFFIYQIIEICSKNWAKTILHRKNKQLEYSLDLTINQPKNWLESQQATQINTRKIALDYMPKWQFGLLGLMALLLASFIPNTSKNKTKILSKARSGLKQDVSTKIPFKFGQLTVSISPPQYTGIASKYAYTPDIEAPANSVLRWTITKNTTEPVQFYISTSKGKKQKFNLRNKTYSFEDKLIASGLYTIEAYNTYDSLLYQSPYYNLIALPDTEPKITPKQKDLYAIYSPGMGTNLSISAHIKDDYAVEKVQLVATLARGNGENVKFREKIITISNDKFKERNLSYTLDIKTLNFELGDELFYYFLAIDNKWPEPNIAKSETFFLKYPNPKDIAAEDPGTMAMQILPEYFRSQRQIIIDTEKLIKKRGKIRKQLFDEESNTIGFDQKSLRIRYGQYLGEEYETNLGHAGESDDPLASFTHDHDGGEHEDTHVQETHPEHSSENKTTEQDPLAALMEQYVHSHDDGEMNTFYEKSTQSLLKMALEQMWQSELHLRLYEPEKALPFENKALEYLKEAQQKARNYVKKTGFDPTPIKEKEKRLTGKLEKTNPNLSFVRFLAQEQMTYLCSRALGILEQKNLNTLDKSELANLIQRLPAQASIKTDLQRVLNENKISKISKNKLKDGLLTYLAYLKNHNAPSPINDANAKLRIEFLKQLSQ